jgi:hypothetical protein
LVLKLPEKQRPGKLRMKQDIMGKKHCKNINWTEVQNLVEFLYQRGSPKKVSAIL